MMRRLWENEKCGLKKKVKVVSKLKLKNKTSSNEKIISEMHWNFPNIFFFNLKNLNDMIVIKLFL
jgi:hypothetical protein